MINALKRNPYLYILIGYMGAIAFGAFLLMLPIATTKSIALIDAIYTATSAICVTGLVVLDTGKDFTYFGQGVILTLIQVGGIGITVFSSFLFLAIRREFSFLNQTIIEESLTMDRQIKTKKLLTYVLLITFIFEFIGAVMLTFFFSKDFSLGESFYRAVFLSVAAFCNAGFSVFSNNLESYATNTGVNLTVMSLVFIGGIGYFCIIEFLRNFESNHIKFKKYKFSIHTRTAFFTSLGLVFIGAVFFLMFEHDKLFASYNISNSVMISFFQSVSARTAGFNTISFSKVHQATLLIFGALMFIGASPASCGGGIKTTTFWVLIKSFTASFKNREHVFIKSRSIPKQVVKKAILLSLLGASWVFVATIFISAFESGNLELSSIRLDEIIFEIISAFGTVGLSTGISPAITPASKTIIILTMYFGRTGLLTLVYFFSFYMKEEKYNYPEEDIFVG